MVVALIGYPLQQVYLIRLDALHIRASTALAGRLFPLRAEVVLFQIADHIRDRVEYITGHDGRGGAEIV